MARKANFGKSAKVLTWLVVILLTSFPNFSLCQSVPKNTWVATSENASSLLDPNSDVVENDHPRKVRYVPISNHLPPEVPLGEVNFTLHPHHLTHKRSSGNSSSESTQFSVGYWVRIAQAQALAVAVEFGPLPKLDELSQLIRHAECPNLDPKCLEVAEKCAEQKASNSIMSLTNKEITFNETLIHGYYRYIVESCSFSKDVILSYSTPPVPPPTPVFHCNKYNTNGEDVEAHFRMEFPQLGNLHGDLIPRYFVLEISRNGEWTLADTNPVQRFWSHRVKRRVSDGEYQVRVTAVSPKYVYPAVTSEMIKPYSSRDVKFKTPQGFKVESISIPEAAARPSPVALLRWKSGSGNNASCQWSVYILDEEYKIIERSTGLQAFWVQLGDLEYKREYELHLKETGAASEGQFATKVDVPGCLELRNYNFTLCAPPPPTHINIEGDKSPHFNAIYVTWRQPEYTSDSNLIWKYEVTVERAPLPYPVQSSAVHDGIRASPLLQSHPYQFEPLFNASLAGGSTFVKIPNGTEHRGRYKITITAFAPGGSTQASPVIIDFEGLPTPVWTHQKIGTLVLAICAVMFFILLFMTLRRFHESRQKRERIALKFEKEDEKEIEILQVPDDRNYRTSANWEIDSENITICEGIGQGNFGYVRRAVLNHKGQQMNVAVKTLRDGVEKKQVEKLLEEYEILKSVSSHMHVVGLKGIVLNHRPFPLLVVEYCAGGDLQSHLRVYVRTTGRLRAKIQTPVEFNGEEPPREPIIAMNATYFCPEETEAPTLLTLTDLLRYSRQIAVGMEYLSANKIVHRDLAARNILISGKSRILKISDFGLSRDVYEQNWYKRTSTSEIPIKWLALECILNEIYTTKSDVWSFGILLWEIFTYGGNPYPGVDNGKIFPLLKDGYRMPPPDICPPGLYQLMRRCWIDDPYKRPDFTDIREELEGLFEEFSHITYLNMDASKRDAET